MQQTWQNFPFLSQAHLVAGVHLNIPYLMNEYGRLGAHSIGISSGQPATNYQPAPNGMRLGGSWVTRRRPKSARIERSGVFINGHHRNQPIDRLMHP